MNNVNYSCAADMQQWQMLAECGSHASLADPLIVANYAWRLPDWKLETVSGYDFMTQIQSNVSLYRKFLAIWSHHALQRPPG